MKGSNKLANNYDETYSMLIESRNMLQRYPDKWGLVYPRKYSTPKGYINTSLNSGLMAIHLEFMYARQINKVEIDCILSTWSICKSLVPTFFVGKEFAEALVCTEPPSNLVIRDLQWPFDGMVFVLHEDFVRKYFNAAVPYIRVARHPTGKQKAPVCVQKLYPMCPEFGISETSFDQMCFIVTATVMVGDKPIDYSASFPDSESVGAMMEDNAYQNFCVDQETAMELGYTEPNSTEDDLNLLKKIISLAAHLLLAMNAVPEQIDNPSVQWPHREKLQRTTPEKDWVWHPRFIGREYRWQRERVDGGGTHASPRLHPRRGHWRHQPHGPGRKEKKVIWIKPMLIGAKTERTENANTTK